MKKNIFNIGEVFGPLLFFIPVWFFHLIPLLIISLPIWIKGRTHVNWAKWDYGIIYIPFAVWAILMLIAGAGKTLSNLFVEGFIIGSIAPISPIIRMIVKNKINERKLAIALLALLCIMAVFLWHFIPGLPE